MSELLIYTISFVAGYAGFIKALFAMMQPEGAFDAISGNKWTAFKGRLYGKGTKGQLLDSILGGCPQCCSFWFSWLWLVPYCIFCNDLNVWLDSKVAFVIWCFVFTMICSYVGFSALTYKQNKDGV